MQSNLAALENTSYMGGKPDSNSTSDNNVGRVASCNKSGGRNDNMQTKKRI